MKSYAAFMLSMFPWDTIKHRCCGEEREAVMLSSKRVHPLSYLFRAGQTLTPGGFPSLLRLGCAGEAGLQQTRTHTHPNPGGKR